MVMPRALVLRTDSNLTQHKLPYDLTMVQKAALAPAARQGQRRQWGQMLRAACQPGQDRMVGCYCGRGWPWALQQGERNQQLVDPEPPRLFWDDLALLPTPTSIYPLTSLY